MSEQTHDRLQAECFQWLWNTYPETRYCCFAVINEMKLLSFVPKHMRARIIGVLKAIGLLPGVWDMLFYWKGVLYGFDIKVKKDVLSDRQKKFREAIEKQGGICHTIGDLEDFQREISDIIL
jgi:hypothetical protein